jgi:hypothetical protein
MFEKYPFEKLNELLKDIEPQTEKKIHFNNRGASVSNPRFYSKEFV